MENEIMNNIVEETTKVCEEVETTSSNGNGFAMLLGAAATAAIYGAVKLGKKAYARYKAEKEFKDNGEFSGLTNDETDNVEE